MGLGQEMGAFYMVAGSAVRDRSILISLHGEYRAGRCSSIQLLSHVCT